MRISGRWKHQLHLHLAMLVTTYSLGDEAGGQSSSQAIKELATPVVQFDAQAVRAPSRPWYATCRYTSQLARRAIHLIDRGARGLVRTGSVHEARRQISPTQLVPRQVSWPISLFLQKPRRDVDLGLSAADARPYIKHMSIASSIVLPISTCSDEACNLGDHTRVPRHHYPLSRLRSHTRSLAPSLGSYLSLRLPRRHHRRCLLWSYSSCYPSFLTV